MEDRGSACEFDNNKLRWIILWRFCDIFKCSILILFEFKSQFWISSSTMPGVQNWQTSPLHFVDQIFAKNNVVVIPPSNDVETRSINDRLKDSFKQVSNFFQDKVEPTKWSTIPSLNDVPVDDLYDGQIVRFRGMIQVNLCTC